MNKIVGLVVGAVVLVVIVFAVVVAANPQWIESVAPELFADAHKKAVRQRAEELAIFLCENQLDQCVEMTDPIFVRQHGVSGVKIRFGLLHLIIKAGKLTPEDVQFGEVHLTEDNQRAEIDVKLRIQGEWQDKDPMRWVRVEDQWYLTFD